MTRNCHNYGYSFDVFLSDLVQLQNRKKNS